MKKFIFLIFFITGASVFSGALAQNTSSHGADRSRQKSELSEEPIYFFDKDTVPSLDLSSLVKAVAEADSSQKNHPTRTVPKPRSQGKVIIVNTGSILDNIISEGNSDKEKNNQTKLSSVPVLAFMTEAYAEHGFYQSGNWDSPEDFSQIIGKVVLPDYNPADFFLPVRGRITSNYGYRAAFKRQHKGIDIALNNGDPVCAALPGVVAKIGYDHFGYGHYVVVVHKNGMETRYAHLLQPLASTGDMVSSGDIIGFGGNSGNSTGPHLHFEVRYNGRAIDPASVFNFPHQDIALKKDNSESKNNKKDKSESKKKKKKK